MYSVFIDYDKYEFVVDAQGQLVTVKRNGEYWQVAHNDWKYSKAIMGLIWRVHDLEVELAELRG